MKSFYPNSCFHILGSLRKGIVPSFLQNIVEHASIHGQGILSHFKPSCPSLELRPNSVCPASVTMEISHLYCCCLLCYNNLWYLENTTNYSSVFFSSQLKPLAVIRFQASGITFSFHVCMNLLVLHCSYQQVVLCFKNQEQNVKVELQSLDFRGYLGTATGNIVKLATPSVL